MSDAFVQPLQYWTAGGPLLLPIALVCFAIWAYFLRTNGALRTALSEAEDFERKLTTQMPARALPVDAVEQEQETTMSGLRKDMVILAAFTAVAPLLGLLGTVMGMIETFQAVALSTGETAGRVASGISKALITTQFGLVVAIPGFFGLARLHRMLDQLQVRFATVRTELMIVEKKMSQH